MERQSSLVGNPDLGHRSSESTQPCPSSPSPTSTCQQETSLILRIIKRERTGEFGTVVSESGNPFFRGQGIKGSEVSPNRLLRTGTPTSTLDPWNRDRWQDTDELHDPNETERLRSYTHLTGHTLNPNNRNDVIEKVFMVLHGLTFIGAPRSPPSLLSQSTTSKTDSTPASIQINLNVIL